MTIKESRLEKLRRILALHLESTHGDEGLEKAADRLSASMPTPESLCDPMISSRFSVLDGAVKKSDRYDLRGKQVRLKDMGSIVTGIKLLRVILESHAPEKLDPLTYLGELVEDLVVRKDGGIENIKQMVRAAHSEYLLEAGLYEQALESIQSAMRLFSSGPYSQRLLYLALLGKRSQGKTDNLEGACLNDLSDRFCSQPFITLATGQLVRGGPQKPLSFGCQCIGMLPYPLTDPNKETDTMDEIWNGPEIQEIRRSILDGDFTYCSRSVCNAIVGDELPKRDEVDDPVMRDIIDNRKVVLQTPPRIVSLAHDTSCNLACPSCRLDLITVKDETRNQYDKWVGDVILPLISDAKTTLIVAGDGDPFASRHYRRLLHSLDPVRHAGVNLWLITNGLLFTESEWNSLEPVQHLIESVSVSIDAAQKETYEELRKPGKWERIVANMEFLGRLRKVGKLSDLTLNFVVQAKNYKQMPQFVALGQTWGANRVRFLRLVNLSSYSADAFEQNDVVDQRHPMHSHFKELLSLPIMRTREVDMFNIPTLCDDDVGESLEDPLLAQIGNLTMDLENWRNEACSANEQCVEQKEVVEKLSKDLENWRNEARLAKDRCKQLKGKVSSLRSERKEMIEKRIQTRFHSLWRRVRGKRS